MPYSYAQCKAFAAKARRGEKVPDDWRKHCKNVKKPKQRTKRGKKAG